MASKLLNEALKSGYLIPETRFPKNPLWVVILNKLNYYTGGVRRADEVRYAVYSRWRKEEDVKAMFEEFIIKYGKSYKNAREKEKRFRLFKNSLGEIDEYNSIPNGTATYGVNTYADWTYRERWRRTQSWF